MSPADDAALDAEAARLLRANDRGGYTVPSAGLYPFQWNWDSALTALGWQVLDEDRAWRELTTLFAAQWPDGMVPHIVFHREDPRYFPGPDEWATGRSPPTSGITQPPVAASCMRRMWECARDREAADSALRALLPAVERWHRWFHEVRGDPAAGLPVVVHPWETGMDNSPAWDAPLAAVPVPEGLSYRRRDLDAVPPDQRPRKEDYDRYITLLRTFRAWGWDQRRMARESPFRVADHGLCALLVRAERDLAALARALGGADTGAAEERAGRLEAAMRRHLVDPDSGFVHAFDLVRGERIPVRTAAAFLAFGTGAADPRLRSAFDDWHAATPFRLATVRPDDPRFERRRYWRGPAWAIVNLLVARGLDGPQAAALREDTAALVRTGGFREYFDPLDGSGLGGRDFSWTAAVWLAWARGAPPPGRPVA